MPWTSQALEMGVGGKGKLKEVFKAEGRGEKIRVE